jgi:O-antigen/teichoic acid export membrane protein
VQAVGANVAVWTAIVAGGKLWTAVAAAAARAACDVYLLAVHYRRFFRPFLRPAGGPTIDWRREIWPMQWRLAVAAAFHYFAWAFMIPVVFEYHGPATAGQMGVTWTLITALQMAAMAWIQARTPLLGTLAARRDYRELDRVYYRLTAVSGALLTAGAVLFQSLVWLFYLADVELADRILAPAPTALFLLFILLNHVPRCQQFYLRAHKQEPLMKVNVAAAVAMGGLGWWFGRLYGPTGIALVYLGVTLLITIPWQTYIFRHFRRARA